MRLLNTFFAKSPVPQWIELIVQRTSRLSLEEPFDLVCARETPTLTIFTIQAGRYSTVMYTDIYLVKYLGIKADKRFPACGKSRIAATTNHLSQCHSYFEGA